MCTHSSLKRIWRWNTESLQNIRQNQPRFCENSLSILAFTLTLPSFQTTWPHSQLFSLLHRSLPISDQASISYHRSREEAYGNKLSASSQDTGMPSTKAKSAHPSNPWHLSVPKQIRSVQSRWNRRSYPRVISHPPASQQRNPRDYHPTSPPPLSRLWASPLSPLHHPQSF